MFCVVLYNSVSRNYDKSYGFYFLLFGRLLKLWCEMICLLYVYFPDIPKLSAPSQICFGKLLHKAEFINLQAFRE